MKKLFYVHNYKNSDRTKHFYKGATIVKNMNSET